MSNAIEETHTRSGVCPSFFTGAIAEARTSSYEGAGWTLAIHVRSIVEGEPAEPELDALVDADDAGGIMGLIERTLPRCYALVPRARRRTFVAGIRRALDDERV